ncbi:SAP domain-containing protein [Lactobacillus sp. Marseille-P7033]|nr:SAP domain-containing protein [Lactobacillus sp. Marseille-P7033]NGC77392.1 SAP domain-containing protein [Limosilactobacillus reuteri]
MKIPHTLSEFTQTYYYKTELIKLCRQWNLPTSGTKAELNSYIEKYLKGMSANKIKPCRSNKIHRSLTYNEINLDTKLINSGFCFNKVARQWFADYFGVEKFSFNKKMAVIKRKAEVERDEQATVGDLIQQMQNWDKNKNASPAEENTYQWNNFVRDFFKDPATKQFNQQLKVASLLWKKVRISRGNKVYCHDMLEKYNKEIEIYKKG